MSLPLRHFHFLSYSPPLPPPLRHVLTSTPLTSRLTSNPFYPPLLLSPPSSPAHLATPSASTAAQYALHALIGIRKLFLYIAMVLVLQVQNWNTRNGV